MNANFMALIGKKQIKSGAPATGKRTFSVASSASSPSSVAAVASDRGAPHRDAKRIAHDPHKQQKHQPPPPPSLHNARIIAAATTTRGYPELHPLKPTGAPTGILALDCEMVGVGPSGERSALARASIVNVLGEVVYDKFVRPAEKVTDYRTAVSGVEPRHLVAAVPFKQAQAEVAELLNGRILVGHGLSHDFDVLLLSHPRRAVRDTSRYKVLCPHRPKSLADLAASELGVHDLHTAAHDSVQDARCALALYNKHKKAWEQSLRAAPTAALGGDSAGVDGAAAAADAKPPPAVSKAEARAAARAAAAAAQLAENEFDSLLKTI